MTEWRTYLLGELSASDKHAFATGPFGSSISKKFFVDKGVPVIRGSNLSVDVGVILNEQGFVFVDEEMARKFSRSIARRGDLVFTCWGTVGQVGFISNTTRYERYIVSNKQMKMTPDSSRVEPLFLYYLLSSPRMVHEFTSQAIGTSVPGFNLGQLKELAVRIPPLARQRNISRALRSFDALIENNRRRIEILEEMARLLYREWFVHFRFPGQESVELVDSDLGLIPEGWEVNVASIALEITPKLRAKKDQEYRFITMGDLSESSMDCRPSEVRSGNSGAKFQNGDILFARITPCLENGKTGFVQCLDHGEIGRGSTEFIVLRGRRLSPEYSYLLAREDGFRQHAITSMSGVSGRQRVSNACFDSYLLAVPPPAVAQRFSDLVAPMFSLVARLADQNETLREARDLLLPRLISGELDICDLDLDLSAVAV